MQAKCAFLITLVTALTAGSSTMTSALAQTDVPYYEVDEIVVKDQKGYEASGVAKIREAAEAMGCHIFAGGYNKAQALIGDPPANRLVIVRCPNKEAGDKRWKLVMDWFDEGKKYATFRSIAADGNATALEPGSYYQVVEINVKDQPGYEASGVKEVRATQEAVGGKVIAGGYNKATSREGAPAANRYLIIQYPNKAANEKHFNDSVRPWWESAGKKYSDFRAVGVEGIAPK